MKPFFSIGLFVTALMSAPAPAAHAQGQAVAAAAPVQRTAPAAPKAATVLDDYVQQGLANNLVLKQRQIDVDKALNVLSEARRQFLPSVTLQGGYTNGYGGRYINLPIGTLLNPVYGTLNELTRTNNFPQIQNVETYFLPRHQYDVHVRTSMPLVNTDLIYNQRLQGQQAEMRAHEVDVYRRQLVLDIKSAYYNYLMAGQSKDIYQSALVLVNQSLATTQSLVANGKALAVQLQRTQAEQERLRAQLAEAENAQIQAARYLNFLLNRDLNAPVSTDYDALTELNRALSDLGDHTATGRREELLVLKKAEESTLTLVKMRQQFWTPRLSAFADLGNQAEGLKVNDKSRYYLVGVNLEMPLFAAGRNRLLTQRTNLDLAALRLNTQYTQQALDMKSQNALTQLQTARNTYTAANAQASAAASYYRVLEKGYKEGVNSYLEWLDARNQLTQAQALANVARFQVLVAAATLERETAAYNLR